MNVQKKILIVDDETINLDFFDVMLSRLGFVVEKAKDGVEGLEKLKKFFPDTILLDNIMPRMSGWEFTRIVKSDPKYKDIPIIMLSALDDVRDKIEGFELGVDDYITKPYNFSEVLARIRVVLRNRELYAQIVMRESRLSLAEELSLDIKRNLLVFVNSLDDLDAAIARLTPKNGGDELLKEISGKTGKVRKHLDELNNRIEKTFTEWENLKISEIELPMLENRLSKNLTQE